MIDDDFYSFYEENNISELLIKSRQAYDEKRLEKMRYSEEEFDLLIHHYSTQMEDGIVYILARIGFEQHPYSIELMIRYADALIMNRELDKAEELLVQQHSFDSLNSDITLLLGRIYIRRGEDDKALECIQEAVAMANDETVEMLLSVSQDYIDIDKYDKAVPLLKMADKFSPNNTDVINDIAFCYERLGNISESLYWYEKYIETDPFNDNVWFNIGTIYSLLADPKKANEAFDYALALNENNSSVLFNKAIMLSNIGKYDEAIDYFNHFLKLEPDTPSAINGIADAYLGKEKIGEAIRYYTLTLSLDADNSDAHCGMAYIKMTEYGFENALDHLRRVNWERVSDYFFLTAILNDTFKLTNNPEFLVYSLVTLHYVKDAYLFDVYLETLVLIDESYLTLLIKLLPSLDNEMFKSGIKKIKENLI